MTGYNLPPDCTLTDVDLSRHRYYDEGREAFEAGRSVLCCPYYGRESVQWLDGWEAAKEEADDAEE